LSEIAYNAAARKVSMLTQDRRGRIVPKLISVSTAAVSSTHCQPAMPHHPDTRPPPMIAASIPSKIDIKNEYQ
jgi:hypothetical protein